MHPGRQLALSPHPAFTWMHDQERHRDGDEKAVNMDIDFTLGQLIKIAIFLAIAAVVGFIIYFAVAIAPEAITEFINNAQTQGNLMAKR